MTLEQIISLTQAGFTKDDIYALLDSDTNPNQTTSQPPTAAQTAPAPAPAPDLAPAPASAPALAPAPAPAVGTTQVYIPQQVPAPALTPALAPAPTPAPAPAPNNEPDLMQKILDSMNNLNTTMQKSNMLGVIQPSAPTTDDMLAEIINPPTLKGVN